MDRARSTFVVPILALALAALAAPGCRRPSPPSTGPKTDQTSRGLVAYGNACGGCHDPDVDGEQTAPPLSGEGALPKEPAALKDAPEGGRRTASFVTARDVFDYTKAAMPQLSPGSLADEQYWEIVAYLMKANGVRVGGDLGPDNAASVLLPQR
ncbi:MAG: c-type cytochrome [Polyangiaceae bacterium]|nr:c-type cytochrome [Polyangiaceae bacterium]